MKTVLFGTIMLVHLLFLLGCQQSTTLTEENLHVKEDWEGFAEPESSDWVKYIIPVREYMYYRTQAVVNKDIQLLWDKYPDLKENIDRKQGVNVEQFEVESLNDGFNLLDANYNIESHERIKSENHQRSGSNHSCSWQYRLFEK